MKLINLLCHQNLNTYHVKVQFLHTLALRLYISHLNTYHVKVQSALTLFLHLQFLQFKYIPC